MVKTAGPTHGFEAEMVYQRCKLQLLMQAVCLAKKAKHHVYLAIHDNDGRELIQFNSNTRIFKDITIDAGSQERRTIRKRRTRRRLRTLRVVPRSSPLSLKSRGAPQTKNSGKRNRSSGYSKKASSSEDTTDQTED